MQRMVDTYFKGRTLVLATMHGKEKILQPLFEQSLGVNVVLAKGLNTDDYGTFSGEVQRTGSPLDAARRKCEAAARLTGEPLVMASEGSFGAHPVLGLVAAAEELLLLADLKAGWEIKTKLVSTHTNFAGADVERWEDLLFFAAKIGFPSHGLILRSALPNDGELYKGLCDWEKLKRAFYRIKRTAETVRVETDMRAHHNPTRMKVIGEAGEKLLAIIHTVCPLCEGPGFAVKEVLRGLPCSQCEAPTQTARAHRYVCQHCGHSQLSEYPDQKKVEDPMYCDECNP